jgi:hypothetical protein
LDTFVLVDALLFGDGASNQESSDPFVDGFKFLATIGINHKNFTSVKRATTKSNNIKQFCFYINDTAAQQRQK